VDIKGKNILVIGASGGIGSAISGSLQDKDANLLLHYNTKKSESIKGENLKWIQADLTKNIEVENLFSQISSLDALIYVSGIEKSSADPLDINTWKDIFAVNLFGAVNVTSKAISKISDGGVIIFISSLVGNPNVTFESDSIAYPASKAGLNKLAEGITAMYGNKVRTCVVSPGYVRTPMWDRLGADMTREALEYVPTKKFIEPSEVASIVTEVIENDSFNGSNIVIDRGLGLKKIF
jgi:3-oxoacyl-[acyl-carrier protein] reductase